MLRTSNPAAVAGIFVALLLPDSCLGESPLEFTNRIVVRLKPESVNRELVHFVADIGPVEVIQAKRGQTLGELARTRCGNIDENYVALLKNANASIVPWSTGVTSVIADDAAISMPACVKFVPSAVDQPTDSGAWSEVQLRDGSKRSDIIQEFFKYIGKSSIVVERSEAITLYSELSPSRLLEIGACQSDSSSRAFDPIELLQVLSADLRYLPQMYRGAPVAIVIPDTGLYADASMPFPNNRVDRVGSTRNPLDPDDGLRPHRSFPQSNHGTYVASIALGGPSLIGLLDSLDIKLRVAPINILKPDGSIGADVLNNAIDIAENTNAVVNLSVGRAVPFTEIRGALESRSDVLFVVAAGNDSQSLQDRRVYPASYGGDNEGRLNLITVAAVDSDGTLAKFSNFGSSFVDIAAPGCKQPVYEREEVGSGFREVKVSGTSFAAPHVSFTAALLRSVWPNATPSKIKRRILSSADISSALDATQVSNSRRLNVVNALAVYHDVVVARIEGKTRAIRGRIDSSTQFFSLCEARLQLWRQFAPSRSVVRRVALVSRPTSELHVDWENYNGVYKTERCPLQDISLAITEESTNKRYELASSDIFDIIFAEMN